MGGSLTGNANYLVTVLKGKSSSAGSAAGSNMVSANAMAKLNLEIQNHWVNVLEVLGLSGGSGGLGGAAANVVAGAQLFTGNNFLPNIFSSHVWRGSTGLQISLQMRFDAWDDPVADVLTPVQTLIAMFSPVRGGGGALGSIASSLISAESKVADYVGSLFLHPPGPTVYEYLKGDTSNVFTVSLGNVMMLTNLIPTNISWEFEERFDILGTPMAALCTVGFMSFTTPDQKEILDMFRNRTVGQIGTGGTGISGLIGSPASLVGPSGG